MNFKEILAAQNLTEEQIVAIEAAMKENKVYTTGEENIDIRYNKLKEDKGVIDAEYAKAQELIKSLQDSAKGNEDFQAKITEYENQIKQLQDEAAKAKLDFAIKSGLMERSVNPDSIEFLLFKIEQENKELKFDENNKITGIDFDEVKTKYATHFKQEENGVGNKLDPNNLPKGGEPSNEPQSLADALKQKYSNND